jgi:hypothetical protein
MIRIMSLALALVIGSAGFAIAGGGCPEGYTPQDGVCKPYRGPWSPYGYDPYYRDYRYGPRYYGYHYSDRDRAAALALGVFGAAAGAIAHNAFRHHRHHRLRRYHH